MTRTDDSQPPIVIFGGGLLSSLLRHVLTHDAGRRVLAFTADRSFVKDSSFEDLPLIPFDSLEDNYPPSEVDLMISVGIHRINSLRRSRYDEARARGYRLANFVSSRAIVWPDLVIGDNCVIHEGAIVQSHVKLGRNVLLRSGANIGHHSTIGDHCFIASGVVTGGEVAIGEQVFVGVGATLRSRVRLADRTFIGAAANVLKDTEPDGAYVGNPARRISRTAMEASGG